MLTVAVSVWVDKWTVWAACIICTSQTVGYYCSVKSDGWEQCLNEIKTTHSIDIVPVTKVFELPRENCASIAISQVLCVSLRITLELH